MECKWDFFCAFVWCLLTFHLVIYKTWKCLGRHSTSVWQVVTALRPVLVSWLLDVSDILWWIFKKSEKPVFIIQITGFFFSILRENKIRFEAVQFSINKPLPSINLSLFYHRFSLLQKSRVIALNQERIYEDIIHFKKKLFPIIGIGQKHLIRI